MMFCQIKRCINNMAKGGLSIRVSNKNHRNTPIFDFQPMVNSKDGVNLMPCCLCNVRDVARLYYRKTFSLMANLNFRSCLW
jgi:hypothetical protein